MSNFPSIESDVLIVGAGGAGMRAAEKLASEGRQVAVISKVFPTRSHTVSAQGGIAASLSNVEEDHWQWHMFDTVMGSDFLGDQNAIEYMCEQAPQTVYELEHMGVPFSRLDSGHIYQRGFGGHTRNFGEGPVKRTCAAADRTGHALLHTLYQSNVKAKTRFYNEWYALDLVKNSQGAVSGVLAMCMETGEVVFFKAKATVLATGGAGRIFDTTTNAYINTGDGFGMVRRAGLALQDMEFWQFHPTGIAGAGCLVTEGCRGEGGYLLNGDGERFMERYSPVLKDLDCRDIVSRCSTIEMLEGRGAGPKGDHVLLKLDHLGKEILDARLPGICELAKTFAGIDPVYDPIPVKPTCHYLMGGIPTDINGQVVCPTKDNPNQLVPGLYAAGECACVSVHGANRLGANSLLDIVVFGRSVGIHLHDVMDTLKFHDCGQDDLQKSEERYARWQNSTEGEDPFAIRAELKKVMQDSFSVFRDAEQMEKGLVEIQNLQKRLKNAKLPHKSKTFNMALVECLELDNLMETAVATAVQANHRTESRGAHSRYDFKDRNDKDWLKHCCYMADGSIVDRPVNRKPKQVEPVELQERA